MLSFYLIPGALPDRLTLRFSIGPAKRGFNTEQPNVVHRVLNALYNILAAGHGSRLTSELARMPTTEQYLAEIEQSTGLEVREASCESCHDAVT